MSQIYKIYREGNYIRVVDVLTNELFNGAVKDVFIDKSNVQKNEYTISKIKDFDETNTLSIGKILKSDDTAYSISEWETFYTENTGNFNGGGAAPETLENKVSIYTVDGTGEKYYTADYINETTTQIEQNIQAQLVDSTLINGVTTSSTVPATGNIHAIGVGAGTYPNWGGMVIPSNNIGTLSRVSGTYSVSLTAFSDVNKIRPWVSGTYASGDQVNHLGKDWVANAAIVAGDVPGVSSKWIDRLSVKQNIIYELKDTGSSSLHRIGKIAEYTYLNNGNVGFAVNILHTSKLGSLNYLFKTKISSSTEAPKLLRIGTKGDDRMQLLFTSKVTATNITYSIWSVSLGYEPHQIKFIAKTVKSGVTETLIQTPTYTNVASFAEVVTYLNGLGETTITEDVFYTKTEATILEAQIAGKQNLIQPEAVEQVLTSYLVNSAYQANGSQNANAAYRSVSLFPINPLKKYVVVNPVDLLSTKNFILYNSNGTISRALSAIDMKKFVITPLANEVSLSVTLISGLAPVNAKDRILEIKLYSTDENDLFIKKINGFDLFSSNNAAMVEHLAASNPHGITPLMLGAVTNIVVGGSALPKVGTNITFPSATPSASGLMSIADKQKLDNLVPAAVTITGSGVTKNASAYGFLPTKTALENAVALQAALDGGGTILIDYKGTYNLCNTIKIDSDTTILFGAGVYINKQSNPGGQSAAYTFVNRGAFTKEYNQNIKILGLKLISNGLETGNDITRIQGLNGQLAFFYIKNLVVDDFTFLDGGPSSYVIHVCKFENIKLTNLHVEGWKDAVHLGTGDNYLIKHCIFKTYDDPIALNAHDYVSGNPELGWITNGVIEDCYDLADEIRGTTGYFCRILAGAWVDWFSGMAVQQGDTIVASNGKMYRVQNANDGTIYTSLVEPSHTSGTVTHNGINWLMYQEVNVGYGCGVKNVIFKNIHLQKPRHVAFSVHFDKDNFSRSYYPNAVSPVQEDLFFENIFVEAAITNLINAVTPVGTIKVINSNLNNNTIVFRNIETAGISYIQARILMMGVTFKGVGANSIASASAGRTATLKTIGSVVESGTFVPSVSAAITVLDSDIL